MREGVQGISEYIYLEYRPCRVKYDVAEKDRNVQSLQSMVVPTWILQHYTFSGQVQATRKPRLLPAISACTENLEKCSPSSLKDTKWPPSRSGVQALRQ